MSSWATVLGGRGSGVRVRVVQQLLYSEDLACMAAVPLAYPVCADMHACVRCRRAWMLPGFAGPASMYSPMPVSAMALGGAGSGYGGGEERDRDRDRDPRAHHHQASVDAMIQARKEELLRQKSLASSGRR
jgi:hypothetical protein